MLVDQVGCCWAADDVLLNVVGNSISDAGWDAYIAYGAETAKSPYVTLTFAPLVAPSAAQRARLAQRISPQMRLCSRVALVSDLLLARMAITAMSWLTVHGMPMRAFNVRSCRQALSWLIAGSGRDQHCIEEVLATLVVDAGLSPPVFGPCSDA
jgi:hypothetical protein